MRLDKQKDTTKRLDNAKGSYKNGVKISLIISGLRDLKNEIRQMSKN